jgi:hypothetical protein
MKREGLGWLPPRLCRLRENGRLEAAKMNDFKNSLRTSAHITVGWGLFFLNKKKEKAARRIYVGMHIYMRF